MGAWSWWYEISGAARTFFLMTFSWHFSALMIWGPKLGQSQRSMPPKKFYLKVRQFLFATISIFDQNFDFAQLSIFWKTSIFDADLDFWPNFRFLTKSSIFHQNFDFSPKFRFFTKISIFHQMLNFWPKDRFLTKI